MGRHMRFSSENIDVGGGYYIIRERHGSYTWWGACQLDAPGGFVVNGRSKRQLSYRRDAEKQIREWKALDKKL